MVLHECVTGTKPPEVLERMHGGAGQLLAGQELEGFSQTFLRAIDAAMTIRPTDRPQTIPQWLEMFDPDYAPGPAVVVTGADEAKTRIATFAELPEEIVPIAPPPIAPLHAPQAEPAQEPGAEALAEVAAIEPKPAPKKTRKAAVAPESDPSHEPKRSLSPASIAAGVAVLVALGGGSVYLATAGGDKDEASAISQWIPSLAGTPAPIATAVPTPAASAVPSALQILVEDARKAGAPSAAVEAALTSATTLTQLETELATFSQQPQAQAQVTAQNEKIGALSRSTSADLAAALARDAEARAARLARTLAARPDRKSLAASLQRARSAVGSAAAVARNAPDGPQAVAAARAALAAYKHFGSVYHRTEVAARAAPKPTATPTAQASADEPEVPSTAGIPAKIAELESVRDSGKSIASQVIAMGRGSKPKSSDSDEVKNAYKVRRDNASRAKAYAEHLDVLSRSIRAAKSDSAAQNIVSQAKVVRGYLTTLLSRSTAAMANSR